jgi:hypothetical protein
MRAMVVALLLLGATARADAPAHPFARLRALVGGWESDDRRPVRVGYRMISADSALVETWATGSGRETMTLFHPDGARVIATHYCAQGNQPRLVLDAADTSALHFRFLDGTNLDPAASRLTDMVLRMEGDTLVRIDTYTTGGKSESSTTRFRRTK